MRTTVDFPEELLHQLRAVSRDSGKSLSAVAVELMQRGMSRQPTATITRGSSGFPRFAAVGRPITSGDVRALDDEVSG